MKGTVQEKRPYRRGTWTDHLGNEFKTFKDMCRYHGRSHQAVRTRLKRGQTIETALTVPTRKRGCVDHLGNEFPTLVKMCEYHGVSAKATEDRLRQGKTVKEALFGTRTCQDHLGNTYASFSAMCRAYGTNQTTVHTRLNAGWTLETALTTPANQKLACQDHLGNTYNSFRHMCAHYGLNDASVKSRLDAGQTLEQALTSKAKTTGTIIEKDPLGLSFPSYRAMANFYMLRPEQLCQDKPATLKDICDILEKKRKTTTINGREIKILRVKAPYIEMEMGGNEYIVRFEKLMDMYHNSNAFAPLNGLIYVKREIKSISPAKFPYYNIVTSKGEAKRISYWDIINEEIRRARR